MISQGGRAKTGGCQHRRHPHLQHQQRQDLPRGRHALIHRDRPEHRERRSPLTRPTVLQTTSTCRLTCPSSGSSAKFGTHSARQGAGLAGWALASADLRQGADPVSRARRTRNSRLLSRPSSTRPALNGAGSLRSEVGGWRSTGSHDGAPMHADTLSARSADHLLGEVHHHGLTNNGIRRPRMSELLRGGPRFGGYRAHGQRGEYDHPPPHTCGVCGAQRAVGGLAAGWTQGADQTHVKKLRQGPYPDAACVPHACVVLGCIQHHTRRFYRLHSCAACPAAIQRSRRFRDAFGAHNPDPGSSAADRRPAVRRTGADKPRG
jgi:hypothetical protein